MTRRRSAREWGRLVREWKQSGETAAQFAWKRGLSERTLVWWQWRLKQPDRPASGRGRAPQRGGAIQLVPVEIEASPEPEPRAAEGDLAWELVSPSGHVLRVYERGAVRALEQALAVVARGNRRR